MNRRAFCIRAVASAFAACAPGAAKATTRQPLVFAAASTTIALERAGAAFAAETGVKPTFSFAASGTLARQIEQGAPADIFISADEHWMDWIEERSMIRHDSRFVLAGNRLALVGAHSMERLIDLNDPASVGRALGENGRLALGEPASVPAGRYGEAALDRLGILSLVRDRLVLVENVRAALTLVARGEARLGIVYGSDARGEPTVDVVATFPPESHPPIVYPAALTAISDSPEAVAFLAFLRTEPVRAIFRDLGFQTANTGG